MGVGTGAEDVGRVVAAAGGYYSWIEGMLGYGEDGVCVLIEVSNGVVLKLDFVLGGYVVGFVVRIGVHRVVGVLLLDFLCCFGGVEQRRVIFIESIFVGRL